MLFLSTVINTKTFAIFKGMRGFLFVIFFVKAKKSHIIQK
jgi:hypothetical protein